MQDVKMVLIGLLIGAALGFFGYSHLQEQKINQYQNKISQLEKEQAGLIDRLKQLKDKESVIKDEVTNEQANKTLEQAATYWNSAYSVSPSSGSSSPPK